VPGVVGDRVGEVGAPWVLPEQPADSVRQRLREPLVQVRVSVNEDPAVPEL